MSSDQNRFSQLTLHERSALERRLLTRFGTRLRVHSSAGIPGHDASHPDFPEAGPVPLSYAQESLWFFGQLAPESPLYNMPQAFVLRGKLNLSALRSALAALSQRQQAMRSRVQVVDGIPRQRVDEQPVALETIDLSGFPSAQQEEELRRLLTADSRRPFQLTEESPVRARLYRLQLEHHVLAITLHHIIADFTSLEILNRELAELYRSFSENTVCPLPELPFQFRDWAARQRHWADGAASAKHLAYWNDQLRGPLPVLTLPADRSRPETRSFQGGTRTIRLPAALTGKLKALAAKEGVTFYMLLLAAFQSLLFRYSGQEDLIVGSPMGQRGLPEAQPLIGLFLNTLVLRTSLARNPSFRELLRRTRATVIGAFAHQDLAFERLVERLKLPRQPGTNPLCQVLFQYLPTSWPVPHLEGLKTEPIALETGTAKFDLTLTLMEASVEEQPAAAPSAIENRRGLVGTLEYSTDLFEPATIDRMLANFEVLCESIVRNPDEAVARLPLLTASERQKVLVEWNRTDSAYPRQACVHEVFEDQCNRSPEAVALKAGPAELSYSQLNARANQLARHLVNLGAGPHTQVAVSLERSLDLIVSLLAILKTGAAYVPCDRQQPIGRLSERLKDSRALLLLTDSEPDPSLTFAGRILRLDEEREIITRQSTQNLSHQVDSNSLAYLMYTSGSTGQAKGVAIPHRGIVRLVKGNEYASFEPSDVFLQFAPVSFDASTFEIWGALLNGAKLVLYPPTFDSLEQFSAVLRDSRINTLWLTAGLYHQMVETHLEAMSGLRQLLAGGDVLSVPHVQKFLQALPHCQLINGYGPTENTTFTCCYRFPQDWTGPGSAPIGRPINNTQVYLLDSHLNPVPIGVAGELHIAGDGLALGYWESPELTAQKFIPNPFSADSSARLYRSGDQARYLPDGTIEFLGRTDDQIKVNGFRIHLQEVERELEKIAGVRRAAVIVQPDNPGLKRLVAYLVPDGTAFSMGAEEIREAAGARLPGYAIPSEFITVEALPLTSHGKVDRRQLSLPRPSKTSAPNPAPVIKNGMEEKIAAIWQEVFARNEISLDDNFFALGGHSLLATRVLSRVNQAFSSNLSLSTLFGAPTVRALARKVAQAAGTQPQAPITRRSQSPRG